MINKTRLSIAQTDPARPDYVYLNDYFGDDISIELSMTRDEWKKLGSPTLVSVTVEIPDENYFGSLTDAERESFARQIWEANTDAERDAIFAEIHEAVRRG